MRLSAGRRTDPSFNQLNHTNTEKARWGGFVGASGGADEGVFPMRERPLRSFCSFGLGLGGFFLAAHGCCPT